jgi:hypothetical protein
MIRITAIFTILFLIAGCSQSSNILDQNFDEGDWLLVNVDYDKRTIELIDDEQTLKANKTGLWVTLMGECGGTTCDGFLKLYKDGRLVTQAEYLTRSELHESSGIREAYKMGTESIIDPGDKNGFSKKWDSLKNANCYPTVYHTHPADKDVIWFYKIEEESKR